MKPKNLSTKIIASALLSNDYLLCLRNAIKTDNLNYFENRINFKLPKIITDTKTETETETETGTSNCEKNFN